jgi:hypothetical protein
MILLREYGIKSKLFQFFVLQLGFLSRAFITLIGEKFKIELKDNEVKLASCQSKALQFMNSLCMSINRYNFKEKMELLTTRVQK